MTNTDPTTYAEQLAALAIIEDLARGDLGDDIAAVVLARDVHVFQATIATAVGLLRTALAADPSTTVRQHLADARRALESRDIDLRPDL